MCASEAAKKRCVLHRENEFAFDAATNGRNQTLSTCCIQQLCTMDNTQHKYRNIVLHFHYCEIWIMQPVRALCNVHVIASDVKHGQINKAFNTHQNVCVCVCVRNWIYWWWTNMGSLSLQSHLSEYVRPWTLLHTYTMHNSVGDLRRERPRNVLSSLYLRFHEHILDGCSWCVRYFACKINQRKILDSGHQWNYTLSSSFFEISSSGRILLLSHSRNYFASLSPIVPLLVQNENFSPGGYYSHSMWLSACLR